MLKRIAKKRNGVDNLLKFIKKCILI